MRRSIGIIFVIIAVVLLIPLSKVLAYCHNGVSNAPCDPVNTRTIVVNPAGGGNYTTIQAALNASLPGDTIIVKAGTYNEALSITRSGTSVAPITIKADAGTKPIIIPGPNYGNTVNIRASWIILDGFEIKSGYDGINVYNSNNTIRNNHIHDNFGQGILVISAKDILIENNVIESNGTTHATPSLYHGIYNSDYYGTGVARITVTGNILRNHAGAGFQSYFSSRIGDSDALIENNIFENNTHDITLVNIQNSTVRNNTVIHTSHPPTERSGSYSLSSSPIWIESSPNIKFYNNIFYSSMTGPTDAAIVFTNGPVPTFDYNIWRMPANTPWNWLGTGRGNFNAEYKSVTNQDSHGPVLPTEPNFVALGSNYHLLNTSPAINTGLNTQCPTIDKDMQTRPQGSACDIGAYEYVGATPTAPPTLPSTTSPTVITTVTPTTTTTNTPPTTTIPIQNGPWTGKYYKSFLTNQFSTLVLTRTDQLINFNWGSSSPDTKVPKDNFAVQWTGTFNFPTAGTYAFQAKTNDGMRIWIDNVRVLNKWFAQDATTYNFNRTLTAGNHTIKVEHYEKTGTAIANLSWVSSTVSTTETPSNVANASSGNTSFLNKIANWLEKILK